MKEIFKIKRESIGGSGSDKTDVLHKEGHHMTV
jgi:hypothetical protein